MRAWYAISRNANAASSTCGAIGVVVLLIIGVVMPLNSKISQTRQRVETKQGDLAFIQGVAAAARRRGSRGQRRDSRIPGRAHRQLGARERPRQGAHEQPAYARQGPAHPARPRAVRRDGRVARASVAAAWRARRIRGNRVRRRDRIRQRRSRAQGGLNETRAARAAARRGTDGVRRQCSLPIYPRAGSWCGCLPDCSSSAATSGAPIFEGECLGAKFQGKPLGDATWNLGRLALLRGRLVGDVDLRGALNARADLDMTPFGQRRVAKPQGEFSARSRVHPAGAARSTRRPSSPISKRLVRREPRAARDRRKSRAAGFSPGRRASARARIVSGRRSTARHSRTATRSEGARSRRAVRDRRHRDADAARRISRAGNDRGTNGAGGEPRAGDHASARRRTRPGRTPFSFEGSY